MIDLITNSDSLIVLSEPTVVHDSFISFSLGGEEIASIKGTFDFSNVPAELHSDAIEYIANNAINICLSNQSFERSLTLEDDFDTIEDKETFLQRIKKIFRRK